MCHVDEHLLDRVAERAVVLAADFNPIDTCNLLVGRTVLRVVNVAVERKELPPFLVSVSHDGTHRTSLQRTFVRRSHLHALGMRRTCASMPSAALQHCRTRRLAGGRRLVRNLSDSRLSMSILGSFSETRTLNTIAGTLWSLGRLNARPPQLLALLTARIEQLLPGTTVKEVGTAMTALWRLQYTPESPSLLPALMKRALVGSKPRCVARAAISAICTTSEEDNNRNFSVTTCCSDLLFHRRACTACQCRHWPMCHQHWRGFRSSPRHGRSRPRLQQSFVFGTTPVTNCPSQRRWVISIRVTAAPLWLQCLLANVNGHLPHVLSTKECFHICP